MKKPAKWTALQIRDGFPTSSEAFDALHRLKSLNHEEVRRTVSKLDFRILLVAAFGDCVFSVENEEDPDDLDMQPMQVAG